MTNNIPTLDDYLSGEEETESITLTPDVDLDRLNRVLHRYATLVKRIDANQAVADAQKRKVDDWVREVNSNLQEQAAYLHKELSFYAINARKSNPKAATINLPAGKLATRAAAAKVEVEDPTAYLRWALTQSKAQHELRDTFKVETKPMLPAIKKLFSANGDTLEWVDHEGEVRPVPGTKVTPPPEPFTVVVTPDA